MMPFCRTHSPEQTRELGQRLGGLAQPGDVLLLEGPLGAGKTALVQGLATGLGIADQVNSPTFMLMKQYRGRLPLYHCDLYRLSNPLQTITREWSEFLYGDGVCAVEWSDLAEELLPPNHLLLRFHIASETERLIDLRGAGERGARLAEHPSVCS
ncbi:MAG: tRNA (adenosine(37)-N6)-threonylcarbamoyltransferase complex ATPase subunit type 1 TsaE [Chloroflexota bacterium]